MMPNTLTLDELDKYLKQIFDLQAKLLDKDLKISMLELELSIEKQMLDAFKKIYRK